VSVDHLPPVDRGEGLRPPQAERQPRVRPVGQAKEDRWESSRDDAGKEHRDVRPEDQPPEDAEQEPRHFDRRA
jgi:hypothetical protein